jgi:hypothetical protein
MGVSAKLRGVLEETSLADLVHRVGADARKVEAT